MKPEDLEPYEKTKFMKLTKILYQEKDGKPFQAIEITVDYCKKTRVADEILSVVAYEFGKERIDVSEIFVKYFENDLNKLIDETDWDMLAEEKSHEQRDFINGLEAEEGSIIHDMQELGKLLKINHE